MPGTTPIYGFPYPLATDFVKDGAGTIEDLADAVELEIASLSGSVGLVSINARTASYTLVLSDLGKLVTMTASTATTITVPTNASVAYAVGSVIQIAGLGTGTVTVAPAGGVTVASKDSKLALAAPYAAASLIKTATNTWLLIGDLA
jgi:hypothetical protein